MLQLVESLQYIVHLMDHGHQLFLVVEVCLSVCLYIISPSLCQCVCHLSVCLSVHSYHNTKIFVIIIKYPQLSFVSTSLSPLFLVQCLSLDPPSHGLLSSDSASPGVTITVTCETGYILHGTAELTCLVNGVWSSELPICELSKQ